MTSREVGLARPFQCLDFRSGSVIAAVIWLEQMSLKPNEDKSVLSSTIRAMRSLKVNEVLGAIAAFVVLISPGFLVLAIWKPELLEKLDVIKLILLSASTVTPIMLANVILVLTLDKDSKDFQEVGLHCIGFSTMVVYIAIVIAGLLSLTLWWLAVITFTFEVILALLEIFSPSDAKNK